MALDQECRHPEEKKSLREEDKKEEKNLRLKLVMF